jgi:hypothetical protein
MVWALAGTNGTVPTKASSRHPSDARKISARLSRALADPHATIKIPQQNQ